MEIAILILAAGSSSRMGQSKQLLLVEGQPLLQKTAKVAIDSALGKVLVVLGANANQHQEVLVGLPVNVFIHQQWQNGMGSSLKAGFKFLLEILPNCNAIMVLVCDQPFLTPDHLKKLADAFSVTKKPIIASIYSNTLGVPCLFGKEFFPELLNLQDDEGAKKLIQRFKSEVSSVEFQHGEIDLDTPQDYNRLRSEF